MFDLDVKLAACVWRAPLNEFAEIDFSGWWKGPTGVFKTELTAIGQAHYGAG